MKSKRARRPNAIDTALEQWRSSVLTNLLTVGVIVGFPAFVQTIYRAIRIPAERPGAFVILVIYLLLSTLAFKQKTGASVRGWFALALIYLLGVISMTRGGLVGDGRVYLTVLPILGILLVSVRAGIITTVVSIVTYVIFAAAAHLGYLENLLIVKDNPVSLDHWIYDGLVLTTLLISVMVVLANFYKFLVATLESEYKKTENLTKANSELDEIKINLERTIEEQMAEVRQANLLLKHLANHDALTGLPNQDEFYKRLQRAIDRTKNNQHSVAVLFIDLDGFKVINDTHGHQTGDIVLKEIANRFLGCIRASDTLARFGGDEFIVILENLDNPDDASIVVNKFFNVMEEPFAVEGESYQLTISMGISIYPSDTKNAEELINYADIAMYQIKHTGKNGYHFYAESAQTSL
jgi:diguanylate cyclase (GGDEF)-like protein